MAALGFNPGLSAANTRANAEGAFCRNPGTPGNAALVRCQPPILESKVSGSELAGGRSVLGARESQFAGATGEVCAMAGKLH